MHAQIYSIILSYHQLSEHETIFPTRFRLLHPLLRSNIDLKESFISLRSILIVGLGMVRYSMLDYGWIAALLTHIFTRKTLFQALHAPVAATKVYTISFLNAQLTVSPEIDSFQTI